METSKVPKKHQRTKVRHVSKVDEENEHPQNLAKLLLLPWLALERRFKSSQLAKRWTFQVSPSDWSLCSPNKMIQVCLSRIAIATFSIKKILDHKSPEYKQKWVQILSYHTQYVGISMDFPSFSSWKSLSSTYFFCFGLWDSGVLLTGDLRAWWEAPPLKFNEFQLHLHEIFGKMSFFFAIKYIPRHLMEVSNAKCGISEDHCHCCSHLVHQHDELDIFRRVPSQPQI